MRPASKLAWFTIALAIALWTGRAQAKPSDVEAMTGRLAACAPCHGEHGEGTQNQSFPRLSGKPEGYLYNQLTAFQSGRRAYQPMQHLLVFMPDPYLHAIAAFYAALHPDPPIAADPIASPAALDRGRLLVTAGNPAHGVPACAQCHGPALTGMEPAIPGLLGLPASYISAQLGAWRYGTRTATAPDCMQIVAGHLNETDVADASAWIASIQAEAGATPLRQAALKLPLACGSEPQ